MMASPSRQRMPWSSNYEKKLLFSFGAVVFLLIVVVFASSNWLFLRAEKKNINQLAKTVTRVVSHSLSSASFSGKHHTRNLVQEMVQENVRLSYIAVQNLEGLYFAHSDPSQNDKPVIGDDAASAVRVITSENQVILYRTVDKLSILEVVTPFRSGYEQQIMGVVRVGISLEESNADLKITRLYLLLVSIALACISIFIIIRISRHYGGPVQQMAQTLQGIMDHAPMAIFMQVEDGTLVRSNLEFQKLFGSDAGRNFPQDLVLDQPIFVLNKRIRTEIQLNIGDEERTVLVSKFPVGYGKDELNPVFCTFLFDITATRDLENQLRQSQKMEAIGHLAGGVAHDFNNLLTGIIGYADLSRMMVQGNQELEDYLDQLLIAANRAAQLTQGLLAFSRKQVIDPKPVDLNLIVDRMESLLKRVIGEDIVLTAKLKPTPVIILADAPQIEQIILNLATNSRDAMPKGGSLIISTSLTTITENDHRHPKLNTGDYVVLEVTDTGCGIAPEDQNQVFEPFFTTKEVGKGTGLGLSMVYGIIKQHGGQILLESRPGHGTTIKVVLPIAGAEQTTDQRASTPQKITGGKEKVLLVEDEAFVRILLEKFLRDAGYEVLTAEDGRAGLELFKAQVDSINLVLLDVIMPRMNGHEASTRMLEIRPELKVLFISGYTANHIKQHTRIEGNLNILYKPVRRNDLLLKMREVMDGQ